MIQHAAVVLVAALLVVAAAPAVAAGGSAAEVLRRRRLRWTWAIPPLVLAVAGAPFAVRLARAGASEVAGDPSLENVLRAALPVWLCLTPAIAAAWKLYRDRRDRLHGGEPERAVADAVGPLELLRISRARAREMARGPLTDEGFLLGVDARGSPIRIPRLAAHATIVGASNSGKTNTAKVLLEAQAAAGGGFVVLDGKGGRDLPRAAIALGVRHGRPVALWSVQPYGDEHLDALRLPWNVTGSGTPTEIKDRIAATEQQSEPYYRAIASRGLLVATSVLAAGGGTVRADDLAALLERPADLLRAVRATGADAADVQWLSGLGEGERSALRGMGTRLRTMVGSDGGPMLLPSEDGREIDLLRAIRERWLVVFTLPQGTYPELVPHVARYVLQALNAVCSRVEVAGERADAVVFVDELSAFDGDELCAGLERGRSAGISYVVATQSVSNFAAAGGEKLLHAAIDNAELLVVHRQAVPEGAELLASVGGTEEGWEHTHVVSDAAGIRLGWDETGARQRRRADRFRAHPNAIKTLGCGEAVVVSHRPGFQVRRIHVRTAST
ncbi:MAG TPA: hypothetical protein VF529_00135 [Solirubrobacteraceae bacterium]